MKEPVIACGCSPAPLHKVHRRATDRPIEPSQEEIGSIRRQLDEIEKMLATLFGHVYSREPESLRGRHEAAEFIDRHFEAIVEEWASAVEQIFERTSDVAEPDRERLRADLYNALVRFADHLRDPDNIDTYLYLRKHCQEGMLSRAKPSQFNTIHIALKQTILRHVRATMHGRRMEIVREAVVAGVDERRLMVSQFYIESRERALRASEEKYRNSIDQAPDPMYEIDPETGVVIGANAALERSLWLSAERGLPHPQGVERHSPVGHRLVDLVEPEMAEDTQRHLRTVVERGSDQAHDLPIAGRFFDVNSALIPYGNKQFIQMILHDVTQKRDMMNELLRAERLAATGTFAAGVAHEVNNPLASISSLVQSLLVDESDPGRRMTLHTILTQITRISATLKDLVNFARPSATQRQAVNLNQVIDETLRLVAYNKRFNGITLRPELAADLKPVFTDNNEIQQVLLNLVLNAADATQKENGLIRVITENRAGHGGEKERVVMRIVDNGIGIPREHLERVFDPFFTTKPAGAGVGLGLSLCQRVILANRGSIRVASEVGKGTTVTISLPVYEPASGVATAAAR